jgi:hypothetical protein
MDGFLNSRLYASVAICFVRGFTNSKSRAMTNPATPSAPTPAGDDRNLVVIDENYVAPSFEDRLRLFWQKNSKLVIALLAVILVVVAAKEGWEYLAAEKERGIGEAFAAAVTPAQVKSFIEANPGHPLSGVAHLRTADETYAAGRFSDAIPAYEQATAILRSGPLASRARLGVAMSKLQAGRTADGEAALKAFAADANEIKAFRAEAAYHLASLGSSRGNAADVKIYSDQLMQLDPASPWTQRALALRSTAESDQPNPSDAAPTITIPGAAK